LSPVGAKRVVDYNVRIRVKPYGTGVITDGVKFSILKVTVRPEVAQQAVGTALARVDVIAP